MDEFVTNINKYKEQLNNWFLHINDSVETFSTCYDKKIDFLCRFFLNTEIKSIDSLEIEHRIFNKIYNTARYQIRSFSYVPYLKKIKQMVKKILLLDFNKTCQTIATRFCSYTCLLDLSSLHSVQWRAIALIILGYEIKDISLKTIELLTREMKSGVFLHYPVVFISSISRICTHINNITLEAFDFFCKLKTIEKTNFIEFKSSSNFRYPETPWLDSFRVNVNYNDNTSSVNQVEKSENKIQKLNINFNVKIQPELRKKL